MRQIFRVMAASCSVLLPVGAAALDSVGERSFPLSDPYRATVVGTPSDLAARLPESVRIASRTFTRFPERRVSPVFWNGNALSFGFSKQEKASPLVFILAGTGGSWRDPKTRFLHKALYGAGFHVVALSSPTAPDFIAAASLHALPGLPGVDAHDLLAVMELAIEEIGEEIDVLGTALVGYSLGATEAAFVGALDAVEHRFNFQRIYLINPPVRLFASAEILDDLYARSLPQGAESINTLVERALRQAAASIHTSGSASFGLEYLIAAVAPQADRPELERALAAMFRLASAQMSFSADLVSQRGKIVPAGEQLGVGSSLTPYFTRSMEWSFLRYLDELVVPFWRARRGVERSDLIREASLASIADWLSKTATIAVTANADDPLLATGDIESLQSTFGDRVSVHAHGGHCGNLQFAPVVEEMLRFLGKPWPGTRR